MRKPDEIPLDYGEPEIGGIRPGPGTGHKKVSDTDIFVGHACQVCGKRVNVSAGSGYWQVDPKTKEVQAWHVTCRLA